MRVSGVDVSCLDDDANVLEANVKAESDESTDLKPDGAGVTAETEAEDFEEEDFEEEV
tara:strand:- start:8378 stop:8551 length:174 start_codon:yes stop_codon:yes gene_type:complete